MKIYSFNPEIAKTDSSKIHYRTKKKPTSSWFLFTMVILLILICTVLYYYLPTSLFLFVILISCCILLLFYKTNKTRKLEKAPITIFLEKDDNIYMLEGNVKNVKLLNPDNNINLWKQKTERLYQLFKDQSFLENAFENPQQYSMVTIYHINNTSNVQEFSNYYQIDCMLMNLKTSRLKGSRIYIGKCYQDYPELIAAIKQK